MLGLLWLLALKSLPAHADFNAFIWDNDLFSARKTDAYYSNGFLYQHVSDPQSPEQEGRWKHCPALDFFTQLLDPLLFDVSGASGEYRHSWGMGQVINTPVNLEIHPADPHDQPYSGLLYASCGLQLRSPDRVASVGLLFGVVGQWSLADKSQQLVHAITGSAHPQGWDRQLRNEVVVNLVFERQKIRGRMPLGKQSLVFFDNAGFEFGPLLTSGSLAANMLYSAHPDAAFSVRPGYFGRYPWLSGRRPLGFYSLASVRMNGVLRNLFLDGNTWEDSPSVVHKPLVGEGQLVAGYGFHCVALQVGLNVSTRTFEGQQLKWPRYGTLAVTWNCKP